MRAAARIKTAVQKLKQQRKPCHSQLPQRQQVLPEIDVSGKDFSSFNWLFEKWGAKCILEVGKSIREHLRYAIQQTAEYAEQQFIYQQTGWKKINGEWYFLLPGDSKFNVSLIGKLP